MRKIAATFLTIFFILFLSINAYPSETPSNHFKLSKSSAFSISKLNEEFSLKKNYEIEVKKINAPFFDLEKTESELAQVRRGMKKFSDPESIRQEIKIQKKKKTTSLIVSGICLVGGGSLIYLFATYEEAERTGQQEEVDPGVGSQQNTSVLRRMSLFAGLISCVVGVVLVNDVLKRGKRIKAYEKELKKFAEEQNKKTR